MPRFWQRKTQADGSQSPWFVKIKNGSPPPPAYTFQLEPAGIQILKETGLKSGDSFPANHFWALHNLGLTYTLNNTDDSQPDLDTLLSSNHVEDGNPQQLSPQQQIQFITTLLETHQTEEIGIAALHQMLRSASRNSKDIEFDSVELITEHTPVSKGPVEGLVGSGYTSAIFGALVCRAFNEYLTGFPGQLAGDFEILGHRDGYSYLLLEQAATEEIPLLRDFSLDLPDAYLADVLPESHSQHWERPILEAIHESQFLGTTAAADSTTGGVIFKGLEATKEFDENTFKTPKTIRIVPQRTLSETDVVSIV